MHLKTDVPALTAWFETWQRGVYCGQWWGTSELFRAWMETVMLLLEYAAFRSIHLVVAWDHNPSAHAALVLVAEKGVSSNKANLYTWCEAGLHGRKGHPQAPSRHGDACTQTSWPSPPCTGQHKISPKKRLKKTCPGPKKLVPRKWAK